MGGRETPTSGRLCVGCNHHRHFIDGYHEKLEAERVFPRMVKAGKQLDLVKVLIAQHAAGRKLTSEILQRATAAGLKDRSQSQQLIQAAEEFIRMYEPHAARGTRS